MTLGVGVDQHRVAGAVAEAGPSQIVRGVAHALRAAGDDDVGQAAHDGLRSVVHRLQTGAALPHHGVGRDLDGQARPERGDAGQIGRVGTLLGLPDDDLVYRLRLYSGPLDGRLDDDLRKILRLHVLQTAADPASRGSGRADDDDFVHISPALALVPGLRPL